MQATLDRFGDYLRAEVGGQARERSIKTNTDAIRALLTYFDLPLKRPSPDDIRGVLTRRLNYKVSRTFSEGGNQLKRGRVSNNTFNTAAQGLRYWLGFHGIDASKEPYKDMLKSRSRTARRVKTAKDLLTPEDVERVIDYHYTHVWKAITAVLWDTGMRPSELCSLDYDDVIRDQHGYVLHIQDSKTKTRALRMITELGLQWFQFYYRTHKGTGPLFVNGKGNRIQPHDISDAYRRASRVLGMELYATLFRKSASTHWKNEDLLTDSAIRRRLGHTRDSKVFEQHYHQYFDQDYEREELEALGIVQEREVKKRVKCWNCGFIIGADSQYCPNCNTLQDKALATDSAGQMIVSQIKEDPELMQSFAEAFAKAYAKEQREKSD